MTGACKHKAAAASIDWMASLMHGKSGGERAASLEALNAMLAEMIETNCRPCTEMGACHDLDKASRVLSDKAPAVVPEIGLEPPPPARRPPRRSRLSRPSDGP